MHVYELGWSSQNGIWPKSKLGAKNWSSLDYPVHMYMDRKDLFYLLRNNESNDLFFNSVIITQFNDM